MYNREENESELTTEQQLRLKDEHIRLLTTRTESASSVQIHTAW